MVRILAKVKISFLKQALSKAVFKAIKEEK